MAERISAMDFSIAITIPFLEVGSQGDGGSLGFLCLDHLSLDNLADIGLGCFQGFLSNLALGGCDFTLGLLHSEASLEVLNESTLDNREGGVAVDNFLELGLLDCGTLELHIVHHQFEVQTLVGLLLDFGSDGIQRVVGVEFHQNHQGIILSGAEGFGLLEVGYGTVDSLADVVAGEEGGGSGLGGVGRHLSVHHSNFPFWLFWPWR